MANDQIVKTLAIFVSDYVSVAFDAFNIRNGAIEYWGLHREFPRSGSDGTELINSSPRPGDWARHADVDPRPGVPLFFNLVGKFMGQSSSVAGT